MYIDKSSMITFQGNSTVTLNNNQAYGQGGVIFIIDHSTITFKGNATLYLIKIKLLNMAWLQ